jgi:hypothetical protein
VQSSCPLGSVRGTGGKLGPYRDQINENACKYVYFYFFNS